MQQHQQPAQGLEHEQQNDGIDNENLTRMSNFSFHNRFNNVFHFTSDGDRASQIQTMDATIDDDFTQHLAELLANSSGDTQPFSLKKIGQSQMLNGQEIQAEVIEDCCTQERPILRAKLSIPPVFSAQLSPFSPNGITTQSSTHH